MESRPKLRKVIFLEYHNDVRSRQTLNALVSELAQIGYTRVCDEMPPNQTIESSTELVECEVRGLKKIYIDAVNARNEYKDVWPDDMEQYKSGLEKFELAKQVASLRTYYNFLQVGSLYFAAGEDLEFCKAIKRNNLEYVGVDDVYGREKALEEYKLRDQNVEAKQYEEAAVARNKAMATAYINADKPVFGRMGVYHLQAIQALILQQLPTAEDDFCFIHVHSLTPADAFVQSVLHPFLTEKGQDSTFNGDIEVRKFYERVQAGEIVLPMKLHMFDADKMTQSELLKSILAVVEAKAPTPVYGQPGPTLFRAASLPSNDVRMANDCEAGRDGRLGF